MTLTLVYGTTYNGLRTLLIKTTENFDYKRWFESRKDALKLLGIVKIEVEMEEL